MNKVTLKLTQLQGNFALITCNFHESCSFDDLRHAIATKFPQRDFEAIYTTDRQPVSFENFYDLISEEIQLVVEFLDETDMVEEELQTNEAIYTITPCIKKILNTLKIQLDREDFESVDEFIEYLPACSFKQKFIKYKETPNRVPKFSCLAKRAEVNEEELNKEISEMAKQIKIDTSKQCSNCTKTIESTHYQCLMCPKYNLCCDCEALNQTHQFHDKTHLFAKLNEAANINMSEILKTRKMLNRNCQIKKLCGKPENKMRGKNNKNKEEREQQRLKKKAEREENKEKKKTERMEKKQSKPNRSAKVVKKKEAKKPAVDDKIATLQSAVEALQKTVQSLQHNSNPNK